MFRGNKTRGGEVITILAMTALVLFIVSGIMYGAYLFIDATRLPDFAGVHVTKNFVLAVKDAQGQLYSNEEKGIKDWVKRKDQENGYEIKYPIEWKSQVNSEGNFVIKDIYGNSKTNSLAMSITVGKIAVYSDVNNVLKEKGIKINSELKDQVISGKQAIRTGKVKAADGKSKDLILWKNDNNVLLMEVVYFTEKTEDLEHMFENILSEFRFL